MILPRWTMSLLCFSMDFTLDEEEVEKTSAITSSAYDAWVLVNDYFSWEKEWQNHEANGGVGVIANAIFLFMRWYSVDATEGKRMLRKEILAREEKYCKEKEKFLASGHATDRTSQRLKLLDHVTAGNFVWSMTTARYRLGGEDAYPALRAAYGDNAESGIVDSLSQPISLSAANMAKKMDLVLKERKYMDTTTSEDNLVDSPPTVADTQLIQRNREAELVHSRSAQPRVLTQYEEVGTTSNGMLVDTNDNPDSPTTPALPRVHAIERGEELCDRRTRDVVPGSREVTCENSRDCELTSQLVPYVGLIF